MEFLTLIEIQSLLVKSTWLCIADRTAESARRLRSIGALRAEQVFSEMRGRFRRQSLQLQNN